MTERHPNARRERGSTSVEYVVVTSAIVLALFVVPVNPAGQSALDMLLDALRGFQQNTTFLLSLP